MTPCQYFVLVSSQSMMIYEKYDKKQKHTSKGKVLVPDTKLPMPSVLYDEALFKFTDLSHGHQQTQTSRTTLKLL
jgi:hypothetical protein